MPEVLPVRPCAGCGQRDDHPRHVVALPDGGEALWHMDCHVEQSGCGICTEQIADAKGAIGAKLRGHLVALPVKEN